MTGEKTRMTGPVIILFSAICFGMNTPIAPLVYGNGGNAITLTIARSAVATVCAVLLVAMLDRRRLLTRPSLRYVLPMSFCLFGQGACYLAAVSYIPVSLGALLFYTWPLQVALISRFTDDTRLELPQYATFLLAFGGLALALGPVIDGLQWQGVLLALAGGSLLGSQVLIGRSARLRRR